MYCISFLVLWSICLSSSLVHLREGPEYLTSGIAQVFISLIRFLLLSFISSSFLVLLRYSFWIFSFISTYYYYYLFWEFFTPVLVDGLSLEFEFPKVSKTFLSILADLKNAVVWMVSTHPLISTSSLPCFNPLVTVLYAPIRIGITDTFMFYSFSVL